MTRLAFHRIMQGTKKLPGKNLGTWPQGEKRSFTFDQPGVVPLLCNVHPEMSGYVLVVPTPRVSGPQLVALAFPRRSLSLRRIELSTGQGGTLVVVTAANQHLAIRKKRCRILGSVRGHPPCDRVCIGVEVVEIGGV